MKNKTEKALDVMIALEGRRGREITTVKQEFDDIKTSIALENLSSKLKRNTRPGFRLILGVGVQAMQQLTGINIISYYLPYVLTNSVGLGGSTARLLGAVNAMTYLGSTFVGLYFIDRWGRRRLMLYGALGQCCSWLAITGLLSSADDATPLSSKQHQLAGAAVFFFFLFNCFFGAAWLGVSWLYPTEINSNKYRIAGMSYGVATNWLINFAVVFVTPLGIANLGPQFYIIWTVLNALMVPIIWLFYPETAGRSLEQVDIMFESHPTARVFKHDSMISRKPIASERDESEDVWVALDELHTFTDVEYANTGKDTVGASREISVSPMAARNPLPEASSSNSISSTLRQRVVEYPGDLMRASQAEERDEQVGEAVLALAATVATSQTGLSLSQQNSTAPLVKDPACVGFECRHS